jgi:hypothetical protein
MTHLPADVALLESALTAIERLLADADANTAHNALSEFTEASAESFDADRLTDGSRTSPARSSLHICLNSAAALLDVSRSLIRTPGDEAAPDELEHEWQTLIALTKSVSRSVYRAALIMAAQKNLVTAQRQKERDHAIAR